MTTQVFDKPTVLVVGAGAGVPYNFPTARQLKDLICNGPPLYNYGLPDERQRAEENSFEYSSKLRNSGQYSIDQFLAIKQNHHLQEWGKQGIAKHILFHEFEAASKRGLLTSDWNQWLFNKICSNGELIQSNNLAILTFNYDRMIEYSLALMLSNSIDRELTDALSMIRHKVSIVHIYGALDHPIEKIGKENYSYNPSIVERASRNIRIMSENLEDHPEIIKARRLVWSASQIVFLGFGYDDRNLDMIGIGPRSESHYRTPCNVAGTGYGLADRERKRVTESVRARGKGEFCLARSDLACLAFLREWFG